MIQPGNRLALGPAVHSGGKHRPARGIGVRNPVMRERAATIEFQRYRMLLCTLHRGRPLFDKTALQHAILVVAGELCWSVSGRVNVGIYATTDQDLNKTGVAR